MSKPLKVPSPPFFPGGMPTDIDSMHGKRSTLQNKVKQFPPISPHFRSLLKALSCVQFLSQGAAVICEMLEFVAHPQVPLPLLHRVSCARWNIGWRGCLKLLATVLGLEVRQRLEKVGSRELHPSNATMSSISLHIPTMFARKCSPTFEPVGLKELTRIFFTLFSCDLFGT